MLAQRETFDQASGWPHKHRACLESEIENAVRFLDPAIRGQVRSMLVESRRVPEEALGPTELRILWSGAR